MKVDVKLEGMKEFQDKLNSLSNSVLTNIAKDAVDEGGSVIQHHAEKNTLSVFSKKQRGTLRNSIRVESETTDTGAIAEIAPHVAYDRIQELGGIIHRVSPKGKEYDIKIPARPYLAPAVNDHVEEISNVIRNLYSRQTDL